MSVQSTPEPDVARALDVTALLKHLREVGLTDADALEITFLSGGRSNLTFFVTDGTEQWVLRRPPLGEYHRGAHDVVREHTVMAALAGSGVPVPRVRDVVADDSVLGAPFYVMDRVDGQVLRSREQVAALSGDERTRLGADLIDTLADLHSIDVAAVGLEGLGRPEGFLERQIDRWERQWLAVTPRDTAPLVEVAAVLRKHLPVSGAPGIVHGDYRIDNLMVGNDDPGSVRAVLDWEMATIGDPLADLGMTAMFWDTEDKPFNPVSLGLTCFPEFGTIDDVLERYASRRGIELDGIDWYRCFAEFKLTVIMEQIHVRAQAGLTVGEEGEGVGPMVERFLDDAVASAADVERGARA